MQSIKLDHFNTFMITMIILIFIIYYVMKYNEITENFNTYGYVACPPQFTKVGTTQNMYYNDGYIGIGTNSPAHKLDVTNTTRLATLIVTGPTEHSARTNFTGGIYLENDWVRVKGNGGIYWEDWGGGWCMTDSTWIKSYGDKNVLISHKLAVNGNIGIGNNSPAHKLDVRSSDTYIAIFKHTNDTQGIGIGYNSINALGNTANQDININPRGSGVVKCNGELQIIGANRTSHICYNNGNTYIRGGSTNGTVLLNDSGGDVFCGGNLRVQGLVESDAPTSQRTHTVRRVGSRSDGRSGSYLPFHVTIPKKCFVIITSSRHGVSMFYVGDGWWQTIIEKKSVGHLYPAGGQSFRTYATWPSVGDTITQRCIPTL